MLTRGRGTSRSARCCRPARSARRASSTTSSRLTRTSTGSRSCWPSTGRWGRRIASSSSASSGACARGCWRMAGCSARASSSWPASRSSSAARFLERAAALQRHARDPDFCRDRLRAPADDGGASAARPPRGAAHDDRLGDLAAHGLSAECVGGDAAARQARRSVREGAAARDRTRDLLDRKSTRLNSSHVKISYAVVCLKKKKTNHNFYLVKKKKITRTENN